MLKILGLRAALEGFHSRKVLAAASFGVLIIREAEYPRTG